MNGMREMMLAALLLPFMEPGIATAHEFWLQPDQFWLQPAQTTPVMLLTGHGHDSERSTLPTRRVTRFEVIGPGQQSLNLRGKLHQGTAELRVEAPGTYVIGLATDNRARSDLPANRFNDYLRAEGLTPALSAREQAGRTQAEGSERYSRHAKSLVQVGTSADPSHATQPLGLRLEIVPEISPYADPKPASLPVRVIFEGQPLAGALVKLSNLSRDSEAGTSQITDGDGRAVFPMPSHGQWLMHVTWTKPLPSSDEADFDTVFASLTFGFSS